MQMRRAHAFYARTFRAVAGGRRRILPPTATRAHPLQNSRQPAGDFRLDGAAFCYVEKSNRWVAAARIFRDAFSLHASPHGAFALGGIPYLTLFLLFFLYVFALKIILLPPAAVFARREGICAFLRVHIKIDGL